MPKSNAERQKEYRIRRRREELALRNDLAAKILKLEEEIASLRNELVTLRNSPPHPPYITTSSSLPSLDSESKTSVRGRATRLAPDWAPSPQNIAYALSKGLSPDLTAERFGNYWHAKSGKDATKVDWDATWRNWCLSDAEKKGTLTNGSNGHANIVEFPEQRTPSRAEIEELAERILGPN